MALNTKLLKSKMALHGDGQADLAKAIGSSLSNVNCKLNAYRFVFTPEEIATIKGRYDLTEEEVKEIFFS